MSMLLLAIVAVLEAVVWLWRFRAGIGASRWNAAISTVAVCATRVAFLAAGVSAALAGDMLVGGLVYCASAGAATFVVHGWGVKRAGGGA